MKYKYIGTKHDLVGLGYKEWRVIFMVKKLFDDMYVHIAIGTNGPIQRGNHNRHEYIGQDDWLCDSEGSPIQQQDIQDLIDANLVEVIA